jgi:MerR family transcriptional regulator, copper efflux regulator
MAGLRIGELARAADVGIETLRFYERRGLIDDPPRLPSGYRQYPEQAVRRVRFIRRAKELGFSLHEIEELLALRSGSRHACGEVKEQIVAKLTDVEHRVRDLQRMRQALEELVVVCEAAGPAGDCPILDLLEERPDG